MAQANSIPERLLQRQQRFEANRSNWEPHWEQIGRRILPRQMSFISTEPKGAQRTDEIFDAVPALALERFAAALHSMLTPRGQRWHQLKSSDPVLNQDPEVIEYFQEVTRRLFAVRYSTKANFDNQMQETYMSLGAFGTGAMFVEGIPGGGIRYKALHLSELYIAENKHGFIDLVHRKFPLTARKAVEEFGVENLDDKIVEAAEKDPSKEFTFLHVVMPNDEQDFSRLDFRGMAYSSTYISYDGRRVVARGGYRSFPYIISRYVTAPGEVFGRGPAMTVLPDIKVLNEMNQTVMRAAHKAVHPPMAAHSDGSLSRISMRPNAINYGAVSNEGKQLIRPIEAGGRVDIGLEMMEQKRKIINDAFLVTLFQILVETPTMTATEALIRAQEKGALLAPTLGRQQSEGLGPLIVRELDLMDQAGMLPELPLALLGAGNYDVEYDSPLNRAQQAEETLGLTRSLEALAPLAAIHPDPAQLFRRVNADEAVLGILRNNGVPERWITTDEELAAQDEADAAQQQADQLLQAAPIAANTAKTIVEAQGLSQAGLPGGV